MSKVTKQSSVSKTVHKDRSDKAKTTTKAAINGTSKDVVVAKRKLAKEIEVSATDEKRSEKKHSTSTKTSSHVKTETKNDKKPETKVKSESKPTRNGKTVHKVPSVDKSDSKSTDKSESKRSESKRTESKRSESKRSTSIEKSSEKRPKDKSTSKPKDSSHSKPKDASKAKDATKAKDASKSKPKDQAKVAKVSESSSKSLSKRQAPLKASHSIGAKPSVAAAISSKNVMNQVHNVTVSSPPRVRREINPIAEEIEKQLNEEAVEQPLPRGRTRTRTLGEDEIIILKPKPVSGETENMTNGNGVESTLIKAPIEVKPPVSFEVMLDDENNAIKSVEKQPTPPIKSNQKTEVEVNQVQSKSVDDQVESIVTNGEGASDDESANYEDDFESYESDFESDVSEEGESGENEEEEEEEEEESQEEISISTGDSDTDENVVSTASRHPFETGHSIDNSEFDSGSFEMKVLSARKRDQKETEPPVANRRDQQIELQNDSGIENYSNTFGANVLMPTQNGQMNSLEMNNKTFDNISDIENEGANSLDTNNTNSKQTNSGKSNKTRSRLAQRGKDLLSKITLDVMNYVLADFKPIPYDVFMKIYGNSNTTQVAVQTHNDRIDQECQSDAISAKTSWSQYPISFYTEHMSRSDFDDYKNGCGSSVDEHQIEGTNEDLNRTCESSLNIIRSMSVKTSAIDERNEDRNVSVVPNIDYDNLNRFLLESEVTLSRILNGQIQKRVRSLNEPVLPISNGYFALNATFGAKFDGKTIQRTFTTEALPGFLFTLHHDSNDLNMIAMWNLVSLSSPVCLLSVWTKVLCLEIHPKIKDIVFAGLDDGSIAVWDYSESKYWHPELNKDIKRFVPSQITTPTFDHKDVTDFGRCISIRGLPISADTELLNGYNPKQMCTLHECGLLILWTLLSNAGVYSNLANKRIDHQSLWSKVKLIQNKAIDLRASIKQMPAMKMSRPTSKSFDKTRSYFESELFNDTALRELHEMNAGEEKILTNFRCTDIELTSEGILISTNENFLLFGRKSFKNESFRRIQIDANKNVRVECMVALSGFDDDTVAIALNNGAIRSLCCDQNIEQIDDSLTNSDIEESSSSISSLTPTAGNGKAPNMNFSPDAFDYSVATPSNGPVQVAVAAPLQATTGFFADNTGPSFGKSCTIQSLVQNDRKIYDDAQGMNQFENMEYKAPLEIVSIKTAQRPIRSTHLMSGQMIMSNSMHLFSNLSRQYLVQLVKAKKLISLWRNRIRIYDLLTNRIVEVPASQIKQRNFVEVITATADFSEEYLIFLNAEGVVELHQITVEPNSC